MKNNINNKIKKEKFSLVGASNKINRLTNNKNNIIKSCKLLLIVALLLALLLAPLSSANPSTIYCPDCLTVMIDCD